MAYSATLANLRGILSDEEHRRLLNLFSRAGLSMDHHQFDEETLEKGTAAIMKTRDGKLRAAVPSPLGGCVFLNDVGMDELNRALRRHKEIMKDYPRNGEGIEAFVDASDTGYTENNSNEAHAIELAAKKAGSLNGVINGANGVKAPGHVANGLGEVTKANGADEGLTNGNKVFTNGARA